MTIRKPAETDILAEVADWTPEGHGINQPGRVCAEVPCDVCAAVLLLARRWLRDAALAGAQGDTRLAELAVAEVPADLIRSNPGAAIGDAMARGVARAISHSLFNLPGEYTIAAVRNVEVPQDQEQED